MSASLPPTPPLPPAPPAPPATRMLSRWAQERLPGHMRAVEAAAKKALETERRADAAEVGGHVNYAPPVPRPLSNHKLRLASRIIDIHSTHEGRTATPQAALALARAEGGRGYLVPTQKAHLEYNLLKKELDFHAAALSRDQTKYDAALRKMVAFRERYHVLDPETSDMIQLASGEFVPNTRENRLREPEVWKELGRAMPMTKLAYLRRLATKWGPTWTTGPIWRLGTVSTTFQCVVVSCISRSDVGEGNHYTHTSAPRDSRVRSYPWENSFLYNSGGALVWYLDEAGNRRYKDGRLLDLAALPDLTDIDDPDRGAHLINTYMRDNFGPDAATCADPFNPCNLGKVNYRLETLGGNGRVAVTLEFPTAFLRDRMHYDNYFGAVGPFLPGGGQWAFMQDARLPVGTTPVLQLVRDYYDWQTPTEAYIGEVDRAYLAERADKFSMHASDSAEDIEIRRLSYCNSRFHAECKELTHIDSSASFALLIEHVVPHDVGPAAPIAPQDQPLGDFMVPQLLTNRHLRVKTNPGATTFEGWIELPKNALSTEFDMVPCCAERDFITTYAGPVGDAYLKGKLSLPREFIVGGLPVFTPERILSYLGCDPDTPELNTSQIMKLYKRFRLGCDFYAEGGSLVAKLKATTHDVVPKRSIFFIKNAHLYRLAKELMALYRTKDEVEDILIPPSNNYMLAKIKSERVFMQSALELLSFNWGQFPKGTRFDIRLNEALGPLLKTLRTTCSLDTDVMFSGVQTMAPTRISFNLNDYAITVRNPISAGRLQLGMDQFVHSEAYLKLVEERRDNFFNSIAKSSNMSHFGPEFLSWIVPDNRGPLVGRTLCSQVPVFDEHGDLTQLGPTSEVDIRAAYPHALRSMESLPQCIETDVPHAYDGHPIQHYTLYEVQRDVDYYELPGVWARVMLHEQSNRIVGRDLLKHPKLAPYYTIKSYFRPFRLMPNKSQPFIDAIIKDQTLQQAHKKTECLLKPIGMLGKKNNKKQEVRLFSTEAEAEYQRATKGGTVNRCPHTLRPDPDNPGNSLSEDWFVWKGPERLTKLKNGFWLIHFYVLSASRADTAQTCFDLEAEGQIIVALNTDAVYILGTHSTPPLDKSDPANLGKRSRTPKAAPGYVLHRAEKNMLWTPPEPSPRFNIDLCNEGSCLEVAELSKTTDLLVVGDCAGAGKSTVAISTVNLLHSVLKPSLFIVPNNVQRKDRRVKDGLEHVDTFSSLVGQRFTDEGESIETGGAYTYRGDKNKPLSYFKSIIFDEIFTLDSTGRALLDRFVAKIRGGESAPRLFATGDTDQLVIEHHLNPTVDLKAYLSDWGRRLFPTAVVLHEPKRFSLAGDKRLVLGLKTEIAKNRRAVLQQFKQIDMDELLDLPSDTRVITYTNETRSRINEALHYKDHTLQYEVGGVLIYRNRSRKQGSATLYKNYSYIIKAVSDSEISLEEEDAEGAELIKFDLMRESVDEWFTYPYASTVHSAQGSTYHGSVVIADSTHFRVSNEWLYVALTRATKPRKNVYILKERPPALVDLGVVRSQIKGLLKTDQEKGRDVGVPVTVDWYLQCDKEQGGQCALCQGMYELPRVGLKACGETASIDRINSCRGHAVDNCQILCRSCNYSKRDRLV